MAEDLPQQLARTKRFRAGTASAFAVVGDGRFVTFLRDEALWVYDTTDRRERRVTAATAYPGGAGAKLSVLRRGELSVVDLAGEVTRLPVTEVEDACIDPTGSVVAFVRERSLRLIDVDGKNVRALAEPDGEDVSWGLPEFAAWMSMERGEGFWWAPDGQRLLVARVDESPVQLRYLADPAQPEKAPTPFRYPAAGTANAEVSLYVVDLAGERREVRWDRERFEYLVRVVWATGNPVIAVQTRDQSCLHLLEVDPSTGSTTLVREVVDSNWVDILTGTPNQTATGELVWIERDAEHDTFRLLVGGEFVTPPGLQVAEIRSVSGGVITFVAQTEATEVHLYTYDGEVHRRTEEVGVHSGLYADGTLVVDSLTLDDRRITVDGHPLRQLDEKPVLDLRVELVKAGDRDLRTAIFRPSWHEPGSAKLPVLLNPYAGPGFQLVLAYRSFYYLVSQWFAEQGFIVLSTDGRGTPGRGPAFERAIAGDQLHPVLDDQIEALHATAARDGDIDLDRVALRGWSFSGYLAAGAVLHRPDVFHAGIAGAAVSDQRGYDTYWKERFLGHPAENPEAYRRTSLLPYVDRLTRPLLIIQGLADTNVWPSHAFRLSGALSAAGKPHELIALPGEGHSISDPRMIENLLHLELAFLRRSLLG